MRVLMVRLTVPCVLTLAIVGATGCASTGGVPAPFPRPGGPPTPSTGAPPVGSAPIGAATGYAITSTALSLRGAPYRNGGADPSGFDCSGFVYYVFAQHGVAVPRTVLEQSRAGRQVNQDQLEPGDLLFFSTVSAGPSHVAIAIGGDEFVHAPSSVGQVRVERLSAAYWAARFVSARRVM
jgi:cell wall-associated NlpC family hydrolase